MFLISPRFQNDHDNSKNFTLSLKIIHFVPFGMQEIIFCLFFEKITPIG